MPLFGRSSCTTVRPLPRKTAPTVLGLATCNFQVQLPPSTPTPLISSLLLIVKSGRFGLVVGVAVPVSVTLAVALGVLVGARVPVTVAVLVGVRVRVAVLVGI